MLTTPKLDSPSESQLEKQFTPIVTSPASSALDLTNDQQPNLILIKSESENNTSSPTPTFFILNHRENFFNTSIISNLIASSSDAGNQLGIIDLKPEQAPVVIKKTKKNIDNKPKPNHKRTILSYLAESENFRKLQDQSYSSNCLSEHQLPLQEAKASADHLTFKVEKDSSTYKPVRRANKKTSASNKPGGQVGRKKKAKRGRKRKASSNSDQPYRASSSTLTKSHRIPTFLSDLNNTLSKSNQLEQVFSVNSLFHSSNSILTKLDLKSLFQTQLFESLPRQAQLKLIKLLPECDRTFDSFGSFKLSGSALNNEFIKKCCTEWQQSLANGEFGNYTSTWGCSVDYENSLLNLNTTITRSTRLRQQKLLQSIKDKAETSEDDEEISYYGDLSKTYPPDSCSQQQTAGEEKENKSFKKPNKTNISTSIYEPANSSKLTSSHFSDQEIDIEKEEHSSFEDNESISIESLLISSSNSSSSRSSASEETSDQDTSFSTYIEESLEAKRRILKRQVKLLKKSKLSSKLLKKRGKEMIADIVSTGENPSSVTFTKKPVTSHHVNLNELKESDISQLDANTSNQPLRKSQRKRQLSKKFTGDDYTFTDCFSIDDEASTSSQLTDSSTAPTTIGITSNIKTTTTISNQMETEPRGDLKLKIKRISQSPQAISAQSVNIETQNRSNFVASSNESDLEKRSTTVTPYTRRKRNAPFSEHHSNTETESLDSSIESLTNNRQAACTPGSNSKSVAKLPRNNSAPSVSVAINVAIPSVISPNSNNSCNLFSPNSSTVIPMTRSAAAKLSKQTNSSAFQFSSPVPATTTVGILDNKKLVAPLPPPQASPMPPKNLFNDEEDFEEPSAPDRSTPEDHESESVKRENELINEHSFSGSNHSVPSIGSDLDTPFSKSNKELIIPNGVKTLAQIKQQIALAKIKRKVTERENITKEETEFYDAVGGPSGENAKKNKSEDPLPSNEPGDTSSSIEKIVNELKSIGESSTITSSTNINEEEDVFRENDKENKAIPTEEFSQALSDVPDLTSLIKQQSDLIVHHQQLHSGDSLMNLIVHLSPAKQLSVVDTSVFDLIDEENSDQNNTKTSKRQLPLPSISSILNSKSSGSLNSSSTTNGHVMPTNEHKRLVSGQAITINGPMTNNSGYSYQITSGRPVSHQAYAPHIYQQGMQSSGQQQNQNYSMYQNTNVPSSMHFSTQAPYSQSQGPSYNKVQVSQQQQSSQTPRSPHYQRSPSGLFNLNNPSVSVANNPQQQQSTTGQQQVSQLPSHPYPAQSPSANYTIKPHTPQSPGFNPMLNSHQYSNIHSQYMQPQQSQHVQNYTQVSRFNSGAQQNQMSPSHYHTGIQQQSQHTFTAPQPPTSHQASYQLPTSSSSVVSQQQSNQLYGMQPAIGTTATNSSHQPSSPMSKAAKPYPTYTAASSNPSQYNSVSFGTSTSYSGQQMYTQNVYNTQPEGAVMHSQTPQNSLNQSVMHQQQYSVQSIQPNTTPQQHSIVGNSSSIAHGKYSGQPATTATHQMVRASNTIQMQYDHTKHQPKFIQQQQAQPDPSQFCPQQSEVAGGTSSTPIEATTNQQINTNSRKKGSAKEKEKQSQSLPVSISLSTPASSSSSSSSPDPSNQTSAASPIVGSNAISTSAMNIPSSNNGVGQPGAQASTTQNRPQRSNQHQLTVAQLLSQKHQQMMQTHKSDPGSSSNSVTQVSNSIITTNSATTSPVNLPCGENSTSIKNIKSSPALFTPADSKDDETSKAEEVTEKNSLESSRNAVLFDNQDSNNNNKEDEEVKQISSTILSVASPSTLILTETLANSPTNRTREPDELAPAAEHATNLALNEHIYDSIVEKESLSSEPMAVDLEEKDQEGKEQFDENMTLKATTVDLELVKSSSSKETTLSIPVSLSYQSAMLNNFNSNEPTVNKKETIELITTKPDESTRIVSADELASSTSRTNQSPNTDSPSRKFHQQTTTHTCSNNQAMSECELCGRFSHPECIFKKFLPSCGANEQTEIKNICSDCFYNNTEGDRATSGETQSEIKTNKNIENRNNK